jgi:hypothetical protein
MTPSELRTFARRARTPVTRAKREHWAREIRSGDSLAALRAGHALFEHARSVLPQFPTDEERAADFAHHLKLRRLLDVASRALAVR